MNRRAMSLVVLIKKRQDGSARSCCVILWPQNMLASAVHHRIDRPRRVPLFLNLGPYEYSWERLHVDSEGLKTQIRKMTIQSMVKKWGTWVFFLSFCFLSFFFFYHERKDWKIITRIGFFSWNPVILIGSRRNRERLQCFRY